MKRRIIHSPILLTAIVACLGSTTAIAQEDDCITCGRETGFKPVEELVSITEGKTLWLDVETDCINCGRETGFLPQDTWATVAFNVEEGLQYQLSLTPTSGAAEFTAITPGGDLTCKPTGSPKEAQICTFEATVTGKAIADLYAVSEASFELQILASKKGF